MQTGLRHAEPPSHDSSSHVSADWVQTSPVTDLDHVAIYIDEDVYYEKSGSGDHVPFRLNTWAGLVEDWVPAVFKWDWRRRIADVPPAKHAFGLDQQIGEFPLFTELLPEVAQDFSMSAVYNTSKTPRLLEIETYTWMKELEPYVLNSHGRASLPSSAFDNIKLEVQLPANIYRLQ